MGLLELFKTKILTLAQRHPFNNLISFKMIQPTPKHLKGKDLCQTASHLSAGAKGFLFFAF